MKAKQLPHTRTVFVAVSHDIWQKAVSTSRRPNLEQDLDLMPEDPLVENHHFEIVLLSIEDMLQAKDSLSQEELQSMLCLLELEPLDPRIMIILDTQDSNFNHCATFWKKENKFCVMSLNSERGAPEQDTSPVNPIKIFWCKGWSVATVCL